MFTRLTTAADTAEAFGVVEFALPAPGVTATHTARVVVDGRIPLDGQREDGVVRFRFSPRDAKVWPYIVQSSLASLTAAVSSPRPCRRSSGHDGDRRGTPTGGPTSPTRERRKACTRVHGR